MRTLVTGGNGFVGKHLCALLRARGDEVVVAGHVHEGEGGVDLPCDLSDFDNVRSVVEAARADAVVHLAAQAFVPEATRAPLQTYETNVLGTARLCEVLRLASYKPSRVLCISSAEVYGNREPSAYPLHESLAVKPMTPYAASKAAVEAVALASVFTYELPVIIARTFNHIGVGQDERFAVVSFAVQLAKIAAGHTPLMFVGNLAAQRDFLDVRDVVRAYLDLLDHGEPGEIYNVCSGRPVSLQEVLRQLIMIAQAAVEIRDDPERMRPSDVPISYGDNSKLRAATGWRQRYSLVESLREVYADAYHRIQDVSHA